MDALLARLGVQAMNMAIRSGIALTSTFAVRQCSRLLQTVDDKSIRRELKSLQKELDEKIKIISPAIDLIEFKSGRGNVFLETAVPLAKSLRQSITALGKQLEGVAKDEEATKRATTRPRSPESQSAKLRPVIDAMQQLLARIERDAHMLQFAISASGENLSTSLPPGVSPSRLMQASTFLTIGDTQFANDPSRPVQIGPSFAISLYMLFSGHSSGPVQPPSNIGVVSPSSLATGEGSAGKSEPYGFGTGDRKPLWQEVTHKARVRLCRIPAGWEFDRERGYLPPSPSTALDKTDALAGPASLFPANEYLYHLEIIEDLDDGRLHDSEGVRPSPFDDLRIAGIRESVPVHQISKIFYTNTGRILNIGNGTDSDNSPALLLKRDVNAPPPRKVAEDIMDVPDEEVASDLEIGNVGSDASDTQDECDSQLQRESADRASKATLSDDTPSCPPEWSFPHHLDSEWMALEVFVEDDQDSSSCTEDDTSELEDEPDIAVAKRVAAKGKTNRSSLDSKLMAQIRDISLRSPPGNADTTTPSSKVLNNVVSPESFVARSPFRAITSSLSLMEVLIRLTSLQEFQQMPHLSIPDHILTFFLEETSTTGLSGEERWKARKEAKMKVGFDPYLDSPNK